MNTHRTGQIGFAALLLGCFAWTFPVAGSDLRFEGRYYRGKGDFEYLEFLNTARRLFEPDPQFQNICMLYEPKWNGFVEGPTWDAWWIQNSYGTTYSILPFLREPLLTFLQNSQDLWFDQMGDGKRVGAKAPFDWVAPDGCLCDAARPGWIVYRQGDGRVDIHDWGMEFTAAGMLLQSELLLISRDRLAIAHYLPKLERCANFLESRRDPTNNLFLAGPAGNLLAPSYAGWKKPDGSFGKAYLAGLSITYIAALDRLIEVEKLAGNNAAVAQYASRRDLARQGLPQLTTPEGYFIRSLDPDGVKHGVYGAATHGYFESSPNHDAIAFRVVDDAQSKLIYRKLASIPGLRPYDFIIPNYPSYDDMYEKPEGLWAFGTWVNGGHWSTCEARMMLAYARLGQFDDERRSMRRLMTFAKRFRMDNPLTKFGSDVYQPNQPVNLCYDTFGPAAAFMRGLFEYVYRAKGLTLVPHVPPAITVLDQIEPVRFGDKQIFLSTIGSGPITSVRVNGRKWKDFTATSVNLPYDKTPSMAKIQILFGHAGPVALKRSGFFPIVMKAKELGQFAPQAARLEDFQNRLIASGFPDCYEAAHAKLAFECMQTVTQRQKLLKDDVIQPLPEASEKAADELYVNTALNLFNGLDTLLQSYEKESGPRKAIYNCWKESGVSKPATTK